MFPGVLLSVLVMKKLVLNFWLASCEVMVRLEPVMAMERIPQGLGCFLWPGELGCCYLYWGWSPIMFFAGTRSNFIKESK